MSVSGISSVNYNPYQIGSASTLQQQFQQLGQALQSGNLSAAQSDFATLQAAVSQPSATTSATSSAPNTIGQAFNQLAADLQSGNLSAAQKDYSTVQQDLQNSQGTIAGRHFSHHHHGGASGTAVNALFQDLSQSDPGTSSGSIATALQSYATLQQQLQQFALGGAALMSESPISFEA